MRKNIAFAFWGTLAILVLMVGVFVLAGLLATFFLNCRYGQTPVMSELVIFAPCMVACFLGLEGSLLLMSQNNDRTSYQKQGTTKSKPRTKKYWLLAIIVILITMVICSNVIIVCSEQGIQKQYLFVTQEYEWADVISYSITSDNNILHFTLRFSGGKTISLTDYSTAETKSFNSKYANSLDYLLYVDEQLEALGKFKNTSVSSGLIDSYKSTSEWEAFVKLIDLEV